MLRGFSLMVGREARLLFRSRTAGFGLLLLAAVAWLPPVAVGLRQGSLGFGSFSEIGPLALTTIGVLVPLIALLAGTDLLAGELEDGSLLPVLTLPIARTACVLGKWTGRAVLLSAGYCVAFATAALAVALLRGTAGLADYLTITLWGLALSLSCLSVGAALGASRGGRVKTFGASLVVWLVLVFLVDAALLATLVAGAPAGPESVGAHGHGELAPLRSVHDSSPDPHAHEAEAESEPIRSVSPWWMALDPVDLFRISAMAATSRLRTAIELAHPGLGGLRLWGPLVTGWVGWLAIPLLMAVLRMRRLDLA
jgi:Cu-processing system permease protein